MNKSNFKTYSNFLIFFNKYRRDYRLVMLLILVLITLDQLIKFEFCSFHFFFSSCTTNTGSAYGLFSSIEFYSLFTAILGILISIFILIFLQYFVKEFGTLITSFLLAGIISNTIDRIFFEGVRDMFTIFNLVIFGVFNLADVYLTFGGLYALHVLINSKDSLKEEKSINDKI
ncbi:MAG: signal peptidase II [Candidatus Woesearchaeota archaeon]